MSLRTLFLFFLAFPLGSWSSLAAAAAQEEITRNIANQPVTPQDILPNTITEEIIVEPKNALNRLPLEKEIKVPAPTDSKPTNDTIVEYIIVSKPKRKSKQIPQQKKKQPPRQKIVSTKLPPSFFNAVGFSVDLHFGFSKVNWKSVAPAITKNGDGGFSMGGSIGQRFTRHIGGEIGAFHLARVTGPPNIHEPNISAIRSWVGYAALKLYAPLDPVGNLFLKLGPGIRFLRITDTINGIDQTIRTEQIVPMFAVGGEYLLWKRSILTVQYLYFQGRGRAGVPGLTLPIPSTHIFAIGFGVKFY